MSELLSLRQGNDLRAVPVPESMAGLNFIDVFTRMKKEHHAIVPGIQKAHSGETIANPPVDYVLDAKDSLILVARVDDDGR